MSNPSKATPQHVIDSAGAVDAAIAKAAGENDRNTMLNAALYAAERRIAAEARATDHPAHYLNMVLQMMRMNILAMIAQSKNAPSRAEADDEQAAPTMGGAHD